MPARGFDMYYEQDARVNFVAMRPAPVCAGTEQGRNNIHISTNCYYGYQDTKNCRGSNGGNDCEMMEVTNTAGTADVSQYQNNSRKRCANDVELPPIKRLRYGDCSMWSLVGTRSSPSHSASALNVNILLFYLKLLVKYLSVC